MECGKYRGVRLLEHGMKVYEYVLEKRMRDMVAFDDYKFCHGRSIAEAMFILRMLQEKYSQKNKKLYHAFMDLEKAFDQVPRKVIEWALRKKWIPERMVETVMALYVNSRTRVKAMAGISEEFNNIFLGVHRVLVLSPLLVDIVMDELMFADELTLTEESELEVMGVFEAWKAAMELKGLKVNMEKVKGHLKELRHRGQSGRWSRGCCGKGVGVNSILKYRAVMGKSQIKSQVAKSNQFTPTFKSLNPYIKSNHIISNQIKSQNAYS